MKKITILPKKYFISNWNLIQSKVVIRLFLIYHLNSINILEPHHTILVLDVLNDSESGILIQNLFILNVLYWWSRSIQRRIIEDYFEQVIVLFLIVILSFPLQVTISADLLISSLVSNCMPIDQVFLVSNLRITHFGEVSQLFALKMIEFKVYFL